MKSIFLGAIIGLVVAMLGVWGIRLFESRGLTDSELEIARSISLTDLPPVPADPSNAVADNPLAVAFGQILFEDAEMSRNKKVSCSTCHVEDRQFQDDLPVGQGVGIGTRRTMPLRGVGYASWYFWDGRKDSLWSQALSPLESAVEHAFTRSEIAAHIALNYPDQYAELFGSLPDLSGIPAASPLGSPAEQAAWSNLPAQTRNKINTVFANTGKSIAAYQRTLSPVENRFDRFVSTVLAGEAPTGDAAMTQQEIEGFRIFIGKGECINCHNGPRMTDEFFHNTGVPRQPYASIDRGRALVIAKIEEDTFRCLGPYSDANPEDCGHVRFMARDANLLNGAFKPPSLRGVATRPPYMHAGQFDTLTEVIDHYSHAPFTFTGKSDIHPVHLLEEEKAALLAFLGTL